MMQNIVDENGDTFSHYQGVFSGSVGIYLSVYATLKVVTFNQG